MSVEHVRAFDARRTENERLYLLLDPLTDHDETGAMAREALAQRLGDDALVTVWRKDLAHTATTCPILVDLGSDPTEERDALLAVSAAYAGDEARRSRRYVAGWLISALEPEALARHIASMCDMTDAAGQSHFFPIHEPLRLELLAVAERDYARQQLGPIREWLLPASGGNFVLLTGAGEKAGSMPLTRVALEAQQEAPHVATVLAAWRAAVEQSGGRGAAAISDSAARDAFVHRIAHGAMNHAHRHSDSRKPIAGESPARIGDYVSGEVLASGSYQAPTFDKPGIALPAGRKPRWGDYDKGTTRSNSTDVKDVGRVIRGAITLVGNFKRMSIEAATLRVTYWPDRNQPELCAEVTMQEMR